MWHWPREKPKDPNDTRYVDTRLGATFKLLWRNRPQPDPGAMSYAWEGLQQAAFTPIGPGIHAVANRPHAFYSAPLVTVPATRTIGLPTMAGTFALQPLQPQDLQPGTGP